MNEETLPKMARDFLPDADGIEARELPRGARSVLYLLVGLIVTFVLWSAFSELDRIVVARGRLVTVGGTLLVQPLETSVVRSILVKVGQVVKKGEVLGLLDPTFTSADLNQLQGKLQSLSALVARCEAELAGTDFQPEETQEGAIQKQLFEERKQFYGARIQQYGAAMARLDASLKTNLKDRQVLSERRENVLKIVDIFSGLRSEGTGSMLKILEAQDQSLAIKHSLEQASNRAEELAKEMDAIRSEKETFQSEWRKKIAEERVAAKWELDGVKDQLRKAERRSELVNLVAPADAVVLDVAKRSIGAVVREAEPLLTLVSLDAPMEVEVEVESPDIGLLRAGDRARIKLDAFPFQKHGTLPATLRTVSQDAFLRQQNALITKGNEAYYLGRLDLGKESLRGVPENYQLLPGMTLVSEIVVGKRTILSYFLYPLIRTLDEGLREP
ncbi:MAG: HlyD family type I secretion periplasmic adaptor subunit [Magnetococcales bacterium]|nr:HlyD family type I secretion periplasmic adaptor subunit [Magnetococcales bacterium]NGZ06497.1 HlyD family type I secretion periplasmic adaptor subunit [Magnetococcales bacterium]